MRIHSRADIRGKSRNKAFRSGWLDGWRLGACQGVDEMVRPVPDVVRRARILYIPQGFEAIDNGIVSALQANVADLRIGHASEMRLQAEQYRPDLVLVLNGLHVFPADHLEQIDAIRSLGIPTAIWFVDDPYVADDTVKIAPHYDYVFTHERTCVSLYRSIGCPQTHHLPLAAHFGLFRPMQVPEEYRTDICFIGVAFRNRIRLFDEIASYLQNKKVLIGGANWSKMTQYALVAHQVRDGWTDVPETVKYYNGAKIVINLHRSPEAGPDNHNVQNWPAESINPRTFEMAACGAFQLTDLRSELPEHYAVGSEIAVFQNAQQLVELMDYYLAHDMERLQVAARAYSRTKKQHTFESRIRTLLDVVGLHG